MKTLDKDGIQQVYEQLSANVRAMSAARDGLVRDINLQIRRGDSTQVSVRTKLLALLYSAWSEAQFLQIAHTPHAFRFSEIVKLKDVKSDLGIESAWENMLAEAVKKVGDTTTNRDLRSRLQTLIDLVSEYIGPAARIRNRIAHGQWVVALNKHCTAENSELTKAIADLDPIVIGKQFEIHGYLGAIVRDLVQSPKMGFHKNYWTNLTALQEYLEQTKEWNIETKRELLRAKKYAMY